MILEPDFSNIAYLKKGNERQKKAYTLLSQLQIFEKLQQYHPILTGTVPLGIDISDSDLDISCECHDHQEFSKTISKRYAKENDFKISTNIWNKELCTIASFRTKSFTIEIFGQNRPTQKQNAYLHMIIENKILNMKGAEFKEQIIKLKKDGLKTEPAFAKLLGLEGNPYEMLLKFEI